MCYCVGNISCLLYCQVIYLLLTFHHPFFFHYTPFSVIVNHLYHVHENEGEAYHILSGKGLYDDNGTKYEVEAGDTTYTMSGQGHGIENIGNEDLVIIPLILLDK
ncbi:MAG: cupin domain-containing protein [Anaerostipes sp.]|nr:cupin domain-containing protein [Anaerostipes sp.]